MTGTSSSARIAFYKNGIKIKNQQIFLFSYLLDSCSNQVVQQFHPQAPHLHHQYIPKTISFFSSFNLNYTKFVQFSK